MTKIQMVQTISLSDIAKIILFFSSGNLILEFVSYFDILVSNFTNGIFANHALGAQTITGSSIPDFYLTHE